MLLPDTFIQSGILSVCAFPWIRTYDLLCCSAGMNICLILTLVLSCSPVAKRTGGNDPVLRSTLRDGGKTFLSVAVLE